MDLATDSLCDWHSTGLCVICASVKKAKKKKLTLLKIFLNEISKVKYKGRIDDSMYHGKGFKLSDGRNTGDNGFF